MNNFGSSTFAAIKIFNERHFLVIGDIIFHAIAEN